MALGPNVWKTRLESELLGVGSQDTQTVSCLYVRIAFFSANLWTPRGFFVLTWGGIKPISFGEQLQDRIQVDRSYKESSAINDNTFYYWI